ncbi:MAG TPA: heme biosynthesis HemY N-terminal domain-containing protein [Gammaproteobacteria bacterium]|jgi:HemY protein|nr:heme biosynthesis HemY N-terminal domain-containing protein [Gammaproteobacteria bacterium]
MRRLIILLLFLTASVWIGLMIVKHPGYIFIVSKPWMIQMPLWFAGVSLLVLLGIFYFIIHSIDALNFWLFRVKNWLKFRREHRSYNKTQHGLSLLIEGRWAKAERLLLQGSKQQGVEPLMNYLGAARAAQELNAIERRDTYLRKAYQLAPNAELAIGLTQAELEIEQDQLEQASITLLKLRALSKRHPRVLKLQEKVYVKMGDWQKLQMLLPDLRKAKVLTPDQALHFEKNIYCQMLMAAGTKDRTELTRIWNEMPRSARKNPDIVLAYVQQLMTFGDHAEAEQLIQKTLKYNWQPDLMKIYSKFSFDNLNRQLVIAGAWLKIYGNKPEILLFLGKTCMQIQLWGKAKDYFERCLAQGPNPEAALEYGRLLERLGENEEAVEQYREVLKELT